MAILKFRVYLEEDDSVYRDVAIRHTQSFFELHEVVLKSFEFDSKHQATFFRSNDNWQRGREISLEKYDKAYKAAPLLMKETTIGSEIRDPNQKFIYVYDFAKNWTFLVELINVSKEENPRITYPSMVRKEGIAPSQYGTKSLLENDLLTLKKNMISHQTPKVLELKEEKEKRKAMEKRQQEAKKSYNEYHCLPAGSEQGILNIEETGECQVVNKKLLYRHANQMWSANAE
ncbi:MAG: IS1096 element passenger TnpR family protein [Flavisolibacter sp.]